MFSYVTDRAVIHGLSTIRYRFKYLYRGVYVGKQRASSREVKCNV